ncbi:MAG TPA: helix-turn-helix domain-containing protein [Acidimicrobiales bacterium]|nr:helix-turn-helix domain-containing protein [Acidimicrobiales bacterium]
MSALHAIAPVPEPDRLFLTRREAAAACGVSEDTLRRDQRSGKLPHTRSGADGAVLYAVADLVALGRLDPRSGAGEPVEVGGRVRAERELAAARAELAAAQARIAGLSAWIERTEGEVAFLRSLLAKAPAS